MTRTSKDQFDKQGRLINGYDYTNQAWVIGGVYQNCGHPKIQACGCYGREHAGEPTKTPEKRFDRATFAMLTESDGFTG